MNNVVFYFQFKDGRNLNLDDTPVNTTKKNFQELLQEKLEQLGGRDNTENNNNVPKSNNSKPKKPFLKKGEGIARFRMKPLPLKPKQKSNTVGKSRKSVSTNQVNNKVVQNKTNNNQNIKPKQLKENANSLGNSGKSAKISKSQYPKAAMEKLTLKKVNTSPKVATWAHVLQQQNQAVQESPSQYEMDSRCVRKDSIELSFLERFNEAEKKSKVSNLFPLFLA